MTRKFILVIVLLSLLFLMVTPVMTSACGLPADHGMTGREFGGAVAGLAQTNPLGLAAHAGGRVP